ncbi:altered inheritance of mitochondria protein 36, mitochondrial [Scheffersomyces coipomensis]|uniref:altered inheritance of mitochondria protein 36, mitochondrial n=1 Tax=Scheffersomyces coipomensis TaxID=1788519 RepID=UPI00315D4BFB
MFALRSLAGNVIKRQVGVKNVNSVIASTRSYASATRRRPGGGPKIRYLFYMLGLSYAALYYAGGKVSNKKNKDSFSEREFEEYEKETRLKRRHKLIKDSRYTFYVIPFIEDSKILKQLEDNLQKSDPEKLVKIIDAEDLIAKEKQDESKKYTYLLQDLDATGREYPKGLITSIIKEEIELYLNTRNGTFETNFIIRNYPQSTDEAIKFENDVSDISKCLILDGVSTTSLSEDQIRAIDNVNGYFETVGKSKSLTKKNIKDAFKD